MAEKNPSGPVPTSKQRIPDTRAGKVLVVLVGGVALLATALLVVFLVRLLLGLDVMQEWLQTYPGEYELPEGAGIGFPAWVQWQHFFNVFLIVLIIRSGLQVRRRNGPPRIGLRDGRRAIKARSV